MPRKLVNLNPSSKADLDFSKLSPKERAKQMSGGAMPDDWDYDNISRRLKRFEAKHPGLINRMANQVYLEIRDSDITKQAVLSNDSEMRRGYWLPAPLQVWMETAYPTIAFGANMKHVRWFMRKFPVFAYETYTKATKR